MSAIDTYLGYIASKRYAKDVRTAIVNAITQCYQDVNSPTLRETAFYNAVVSAVNDSVLTGLGLGDGDVTTAKIYDGAVTADKLAANAVTTGKVANGAITQDKLDPNIEFVTVDDDLETAGAAADAKATGDAIDALNASLEASTFSAAAKSALLNLLANVAWTNDKGSEYYEALRYSIYGDTLFAIYNQSAIVDMGTSLSALESDLTVKVVNPDGTTEEVDDYTLTGTLDSEISEVTVSYNDKTTTFKVICAPSGRWVNNVLTLSSSDLKQGAFNGEPPAYTNDASNRVLYYGAKIDFDSRYKYTISATSSLTLNVAVRGVLKGGIEIFVNSESYLGANVITDTGWQSNGYTFNASGDTDTDTKFLFIPVKRTGTGNISPSNITSLKITRALL